jgi:RNA polymerase sigma-70 factor (ECF subfamily)
LRQFLHPIGKRGSCAMSEHVHAIAYAALSDDELVALARRGQREAFRHIMQRGNQRLFRVARAVLNDDAEAEDALQDAYTHAFAHLDGFRGEASVMTWMTRIVLNEAYARLRRRRSTVGMEQIEAAQQDEGRVLAFPSRYGAEDPATHVARAQLRELAEHAIEALPEPFRVVFVLREIEGCSVEETATALGIRAETVKTRLHRARRLLHEALHDSLAGALADAFPFLGPRCARITEAVLQRVGNPAAPPGG